MNIPPRTDPLAVALGNASLLGVGYLLLGRRRLAAGALAVTVVLLATNLAVASVWCEVAVLVWWAAVIAHGWLVARGRTDRATVGRHRLIALAATVLVALIVGLLRFDTARIERGVAEARAQGSCPAVRTAQDRVWFGDRLADAPLAARGDATVRTCQRLDAANAALATALKGDPGALKTGYGALESALRAPGNDKIVGTALSRFLAGLPVEDACDTVAITDWLRSRGQGHGVLDRSAATVRQVAPKALMQCGDDFMKSESWETARSRYRQLVTQYPDDERADEAEKGAELANVSDLLSTDSGKPRYCSHPAKYRGAGSYGKGTNRAMYFGNDDYTDRLPGSWRTGDPADATLVVCADDDKNGDSVQTCPYRWQNGDGTSSVTFHKIAIPVKVYELRTGKRVADRKLQISGSSCPSVIKSPTYSGSTGIPPESDRYVNESTSDVRHAFRSLIIR